MYAALGLDGLKKQQEHFENVICGSSRAPVSEKVSEFLNYGIENEANAAATLAGKVLPIMFPGKILCEEGFVEMDEFNGSPFIVVSPDGSIRKDPDMRSTEVAVEFKCPVMDLHKSLPPRYLLQCQAEINALDVNSLVYLCWKPDVSSVFLVKRNDDLYARSYKYAEELYKTDSPKRMKSLSDELKQLKHDIGEACKSTNVVEFIGLFPSIVHDNNTEGKSDVAVYRMVRLQHLLSQIVKVFESKHEIMREKATEAVVFLCSALDRDASSTSVSVPVCWFTKGNSLDSATMRKILEYVLSVCHEAGLHIPAISFDGQWHNIAIRDENNRPLTKLQLQKDVWRKTESMKKQAILTELKDLNKEADWITSYNRSNKIVIHDAKSKSNQRLPTISKRVAEQRKKEPRSIKQKENVATEVDVTPEEGKSNTDERHVKETEGNDQTINADANEMHKESKQTEEIDIQKASVILNMLKTDVNCDKKGMWNGKTPEYVVEICQSVDKLNSLRELDLRVIVRYLKKIGHRKLKESVNKVQKLIKIFDVLGLQNDKLIFESKRKQHKPRVQKTVRSLKDLAFGEVSKLKKSDLNIVYAEYIWPERLAEWQTKAFISRTDLYEETKNRTGACEDLDLVSEEDNSTYKEVRQNKDGKYNNGNDLFYIPAYRKERQQYEVSCIDSSHLLTRTRRKSCKGGISDCSNEAWKKVAKSGNTNLSVAMADCNIDPMSVPTAMTHFSEAVENEMVRNGDIDAAKLCRDIREWWRSEDEPGLSAKERVGLRVALRQRLLNYVDFSHFPPPGMFIHGWPTQLWEAMLANIDAKTLLYALSKQKSYNTRSFSSLVGETFFSELTLYDRRGQGTVTSTEFQGFIGTAVEKLHMRFDNERNFVYRTSRKTVYKLMDEKDFTTCDEKSVSNEDISLHDHFFDVKGRARIKGRKREETVSKGRNAVLRGSLGVRWEKARRNDSKLLPTVRMGIND